MVPPSPAPFALSFARRGSLHRLAELDKSGDAREHAAREFGLATKKAALAVRRLDEADDHLFRPGAAARRRQSRDFAPLDDAERPLTHTSSGARQSTSAARE